MIERDATTADLAAIDALYRESFVATFGHLYSAEDLATFLAGFTLDSWGREFDTPGYAFRVVEDEQGIAAFAKVSDLQLPAIPDGPAIELRQLYALERAKGSGAAQALMDWVFATARARGAREVWLSVYIDNHRAQRFYARHGFEDRGRHAFMVGKHEDQDRLMRAKL